MKIAAVLAVALLAHAPVIAQVAASAPSPFVVPPLTASAATRLPACDCLSYPFTPNPPCYGLCVGRLVKTNSADLSSVKGLDPGVAVSIKVLAASPTNSQVDFSKLLGKTQLETAAQKATQGSTIKIEPSTRQIQMSR